MSATDLALRDYAKLKQSLGDLLQQLLAAMTGDEDEREEAERGRALLTKLAEDRFLLAVVGQFNRGKSSLLNALIGRKILPTGVLPVTSVLTSVTYGVSERAIVKRKDSTLSSVVPLEAIGEFVTEASNPGNREQIQEVVIETALPIARRGVSFVDTPGIASARVQNTATTYGFLPHLDAVIFVTSVDSPMSAPELDLLAEAARFARKIFVVINKIDLVETPDLERCVDWVKQETGRTCGTEPPVYPLSSLHALESNTAGDQAAYERSGLPALVRDIERFLAEKGREALLDSVLEKAIHLASTVDSRAQLACQVRQMRMEGADHVLQDLSHRLEDAERETEAALAELRDSLIPFAVSRVEEAAISTAPAWSSMLDSRIASACASGESSADHQPPRDPQDLLALELADEQTRWLTETLRGMRASLVMHGQAGLERIARALARLDRAPGDGAIPLSPPQGSDAQALTLPEITVLPVLPARLDERATPVNRLLPEAWRRRVLAGRLRAHADTIIRESRERVVASCKSSLSLMMDTLRREVQRPLRRRRKTLSVPVEAPQEKAPAADLIRSTVQSLQALRTSIPPGTAHGQSSAEEIVPLQSWVNSSSDVMQAPPADTKARCRICASQANALFDLFAEWQYLLSRDAGFRDAFVREGGFCPLHTWQFEQIASPQTISFGFAPLLESLADKLQRRAGNDSEDTRAVLESLVPRDHSCAVCAFLGTVERKELDRLTDELETLEGRRSFESSFGLCLPHLREAVFCIEHAPARELLLRHQVLKLEEAVDNMKEYSIKRESLHRELLREGEQSAWHAGLRRLVGERNASMSRRTDD